MCQPQRSQTPSLPTVQSVLPPGNLQCADTTHYAAQQTAHIGLALAPSLLIALYAMTHSQAALDAAQAAARELNQDHLLPAHDLCRAFSLVRALRNRQSPEADMFHAAAQLAGHRLIEHLGALPQAGVALTARITSPLIARLMPLIASMRWLH